MLKLVGLFSLSSGALLEAATGNQHEHESLLFGHLWPKLAKDDIVLADRAFCSYGAMAALQKKGVDTVVRLHHLRPSDFRAGRPLGPEDRLIQWQKPGHCPPTMNAQEFAALPETLALRMIRLRMDPAGFRTRSAVIVTTLIDPILYPAAKLRELYGQRWQVELHFAQIKTSLGMDVLRCKSPAMIEREVRMHQIAYNLVRSLMQRGAHLHGAALARLSFKGALDTLRHWAPLIASAGATPRKQDKLIDQMLALIADNLVPARPGRSEPRARKRRPKAYPLLNKARRQMRNPPRCKRSKPKHPKPALS